MFKRLLCLLGAVFLSGCGCSDKGKIECVCLDQRVYKIVDADDFDEGNENDCIKLSELDLKSGFIHASCDSQINSILKKFFTGKGSVLALELDLDVLKNAGIKLVMECNKPGGKVYPHLYGAQKIPLNAVKNKFEYKELSDGEWHKHID